MQSNNVAKKTAIIMQMILLIFKYLYMSEYRKYLKIHVI